MHACVQCGTKLVTNTRRQRCSCMMFRDTSLHRRKDSFAVERTRARIDTILSGVMVILVVAVSGREHKYAYKSVLIYQQNIYIT